MSRLIVQHPKLGETAVAGFAAEIGRPADRRAPELACWDDVQIDSPRLATLADKYQVDAEILSRVMPITDFRLIAFDMDSTLITIECIDEIADFAGRKAEVSAITEATMRGEIANFDESLRRRVALLADLDERVLDRVFEERLRLSPGAESLLRWSREAGLKVLLVSGGFTYFTDRLAARLGIDFVRANRLEIINGRLSGKLVGEIVNAGVKRDTLAQTCASIGCTSAQAIVVGDGANDLEMMRIAGISVAYHAKPIVRSQTTHDINHCGLDAIINYFG